ncbi:hypothetical protein AVEN_67069-1 [Araneus ventricosus]|uniref:Uncharacterized protein n=1 Tax=Araneus ventricosus TaxID=182803 RepID=A0A4Y2RYG3_ARAVE|nr:hypothetical protein AVEN_67069-1 [Araneus ventricosus]
MIILPTITSGGLLGLFAVNELKQGLQLSILKCLPQTKFSQKAQPRSKVSSPSRLWASQQPSWRRGQQESVPIQAWNPQLGSFAQVFTTIRVKITLHVFEGPSFFLCPMSM